MKNVFVKLTEYPKFIDNKGVIPCWVNMSRVQEIRPVLKEDGYKSKLTMNIPDYEIYIVEPPETIMALLAKANQEPDNGTN